MQNLVYRIVLKIFTLMLLIQRLVIGSVDPALTNQEKAKELEYDPEKMAREVIYTKPGRWTDELIRDKTTKEIKEEAVREVKQTGCLFKVPKFDSIFLNYIDCIYDIVKYDFNKRYNRDLFYTTTYDECSMIRHVSDQTQPQN